MDYFTNWVEAESYSSVTMNDEINFIWKFIICRFSLPNSPTMDNRTQFNNLKVEGFCEMYGIRVNYSLVYHPQANCMAEAMNKAVVGRSRQYAKEPRRQKRSLAGGIAKSIMGPKNDEETSNG